MAPSSNTATSPDTAPAAPLQNTNRWETRQLVTMALLCAIGVLLSFVEFPLLPAAPFLKYDASFVPAMVGGFAFGPGAGAAIGIVGIVIHGIIMADLPGSVMNILVVVAYILPAAFVYRKVRSLKGAAIGLACGVVAAVVLAIAGNLVITPLYLGTPVESVIGMILPILIPFNLIKAVVNSLLTVIVYKSVSNLITPKKKQVKGR